MTTVDDVSRPSRIAEPDEGISAEELRLAARNHGMPLEALRYDVTPAGLHYLLIHYDIPDVDPAAHALTIDGAVDRPLSSRPGRAAGRGPGSPTGSRWSAPATGGRCCTRGRSASRGWSRRSAPPSGPARRWRRCCARPGSPPDAVDVVFTGADHGVERGVEQDYQRALPLARRCATTCCWRTR